MANKKRSAEESGATTRSSKHAKTDAASTPSKAKAGKRGAKANIAGDDFKARALPLHVNVTNTPPSIPDETTVPAATEDPGFIGTTTLVPSLFATGSYGWKGNKRVTIEVPNPNGEGSGEKVQVLITINATVIGSKKAGGGSAQHKDEEDEHKDDHEDEAEHKDEAEHAKSDEAEGENVA